jgi:hypothetical protein
MQQHNLNNIFYAPLNYNYVSVNLLAQQLKERQYSVQIVFNIQYTPSSAVCILNEIIAVCQFYSLSRSHK